MKQIELNLQKRLLIVEVDDNISTAENIKIDDGVLKYDVDKYLDGNSNVWICNKNELSGKFELICKGSELTEEVCETLISKKDVAKNQSKMCGLKFKEGFINMVKESGYYWGENPIQEPEEYKDWIEKDKYPGFFAFEKCKTYQESESKTFDLNKTLIFEIL